MRFTFIIFTNFTCLRQDFVICYDVNEFTMTQVENLARWQKKKRNLYQL